MSRVDKGIPALSADKQQLLDLLKRQAVDPAARAPADTASVLESQLVEIWRDVLAASAVGVHDNYFRLGGDSIKSIQIAARARKLGHPVTSRMVLAHPTVARLARMIGHGGNDIAGAAAEKLPEQRYRLTPMQAGLLFECLSSPKLRLYCSCLTLRVTGALDVDLLRLAWNRMLMAHPVLRTRFEIDVAGEPMQVVEPRVGCDVVYRDFTADTSAEWLSAFESSLAEHVMTPQSAPLARLGVARAAPDVCFVVFAHHHLVLDGWSQQIVLQQLFTSYAGYARGRETALEAGPSFADFIARSCAASTADAAFWRSYLRGSDGAARPTTHAPTTRAASARARIASDDTRVLRGLAADAGVTVATVAQAILALVAMERRAGDTVCYGLTVSGRDLDSAKFDASTVVGLCINTVPVFVRAPMAGTIIDFVKEVDTNLTMLMPHHHAALVDVNKAAFGSARSPIFDTLVVIENLPTIRVEDLPVTIELERFSVDEGLPLALVVHVDEGLEFEVRSRLGDNGSPTTILERVAHCCRVIADGGPSLPIGELRRHLRQPADARRP